MNINYNSDTPASVKRRRRGIDWTVLVQLLAMVPSLLVGLGIVVLLTSLLLGYIPNRPAWTQWAPLGAAGLWFLLGFLWFAPFMQSFLAQSFLLLRPPVQAELRHMEYSWHEVLRRAGLDNRAKFRLWIQDTNELNASAAGGSIVSVTRGALRYSGDHLGAVLAHELGHHLNGHTYPGLLAWWFSRPLYWLRRLVRLALRIALAILRFISYLNALVALVGYLFVGTAYLTILIGLVRGIVWAWETSWIAVVVLALAFALAPVMNRQAEYRADRIAVQLGYGPALVDVFREWQNFGFEDHGRRGLRALYLASHPPLHARIRRIENQLTHGGRYNGGTGK
ncbi:M48 family metalloprotease [Arthrobacter sp. E44]|uniref:M48 family metalloprotease n=1 Tax=Arthrobacter sp. E44 TaxID=3341794 RepID=UPI0035A660D4